MIILRDDVVEVDETEAKEVTEEWPEYIDTSDRFELVRVRMVSSWSCEGCRTSKERVRSRSRDCGGTS